MAKTNEDRVAEIDDEITELGKEIAALRKKIKSLNAKKEPLLQGIEAERRVAALSDDEKRMLLQHLQAQGIESAEKVGDHG